MLLLILAAAETLEDWAAEVTGVELDPEKEEDDDPCSG